MIAVIILCGYKSGCLPGPTVSTHAGMQHISTALEHFEDALMALSSNGAVPPLPSEPSTSLPPLATKEQADFLHRLEGLVDRTTRVQDLAEHLFLHEASTAARLRLYG